MTILHDASTARQTYRTRTRLFGLGLSRPTTKRPSDRPTVLDDAQRLAMLYGDPAEDAAVDARYSEVQDEERYMTGSWAF